MDLPPKPKIDISQYRDVNRSKSVNVRSIAENKSSGTPERELSPVKDVKRRVVSTAERTSEARAEISNKIQNKLPARSEFRNEIRNFSQSETQNKNEFQNKALNKNDILTENKIEVQPEIEIENGSNSSRPSVKQALQLLNSYSQPSQAPMTSQAPSQISSQVSSQVSSQIPSQAPSQVSSQVSLQSTQSLGQTIQKPSHPAPLRPTKPTQAKPVLGVKPQNRSTPNLLSPENHDTLHPQNNQAPRRSYSAANSDTETPPPTPARPPKNLNSASSTSSTNLSSRRPQPVSRPSSMYLSSSALPAQPRPRLVASRPVSMVESLHVHDSRDSREPMSPMSPMSPRSPRSPRSSRTNSPELPVLSELPVLQIDPPALPSRPTQPSPPAQQALSPAHFKSPLASRSLSLQTSMALQTSQSSQIGPAGPLGPLGPSGPPGQRSRPSSIVDTISEDVLNDTIALKTHNVMKYEPSRVPFTCAKPRRILACSSKYVLLYYSKPKIELYDTRTNALIWKQKLMARCALFVNDEIWVGLSSGQIHILNVKNGVANQKLEKQHTKPVTLLARNDHAVLSLSMDDGRVCTWPAHGIRPMHINRVLGVPVHASAGGEPMVLYTSKEHRIDMYISGTNFLPAHYSLPRKGAKFGVCTAMISTTDTMFCGQNDGNISIFSQNQRIGTLNAGINSVTALAMSSGNELWVGTSLGAVLIFQLSLPYNGSASATLVRQFKVFNYAVAEIVSADAFMFLLDRNSELVVYNAAPSPSTSAPINGLHETSSSDAIASEFKAADPRNSISASVGVEDRSGMQTKSQTPAYDNSINSFGVENSSTNVSVGSNDLKVSIMTWNIGSAKPEQVEPKWLIMHGDVCVYGLQEVTELENKQQQVVTMLGSTPEEHDAWRIYLEQLNCPRGYTLVAARDMVGIFTCIFVKNGIHASEAACKLVKTGMGGTYGNKGGVILSLHINHTLYSFVNVHLAAGQGSVMQRNKDADQVMSSCPSSKYTFFFGDTNYRLNTVRERAFQLIQNQDFASLRKFDQLYQQTLKNPSFVLSQFAEADIHFTPTYKFDVMTSRYDTSDKKRVPAYCDRILFLGDRIQVDYYSSINTLASDHKAVVGYYTVKQ